MKRQTTTYKSNGSYALPKWCCDLRITAGGWEPLMYIRRDANGENYEDAFTEQHSDAYLAEMARNGVDLFITHYHKGFGWRVIQEELRDVKRQVATIHRRGYRAGVYFRVDNIFGETFFREMPEARNWVVRSYSGKPIAIMGRPFRLRVCRNAPAYRRYAQKVLRYAVEEIGVDAFSLDGAGGPGEAQACHCAHCQKRFQAFLRRRWTKHPADAQKRFGFADTKGLTIPVPSGGNRSEATARIITDPLYQEYIRFRCEDWADWQKFLTGFVRELNPEAIAILNCGVFAWQNTSAMTGNYLPLMDRRNTLIFIEDGHFPAVREGGVLCHRIRDYKVAASVGVKCISYTHEYTVPYLKRAMCESAAFNGGILGHINTAGDANASIPAVGHAEKAAQTAVIEWRRQYAHLWDNNESASEIGVLRSYESMAFDCLAAMRHTMLIEETLIRRQIPFDIVFDEQLPALLGKRIRVLILGNQSCLSRPVLDQIVRFVAAGGKLIVTGQTGERSAAVQRLKENALMKALDLRGKSIAINVAEDIPPMPDRQDAHFESIFSDLPAASQAWTWPSKATLYPNALKRGAVMYVPEVLPSVKEEIWYPNWHKDPHNPTFWNITANLPPPVTHKEYAYTNWRLPINAGQIVDAIRAVYRAPFLIDAPDTLAVNWLRQPQERLDLIHWLNYNNDHPIYGAALLLPRKHAYAKAIFYQLDPEPTVTDCSAQLEDDRLTLPIFLTYGILALTKRDKQP